MKFRRISFNFVNNKYKKIIFIILSTFIIENYFINYNN